MLAFERLIIIERELEHKKVLTIKEVAEKLDISESTVRRDFDELEKKGTLVKVYGGVMRSKASSTLSDTGELTMKEKAVLNGEAKRNLCAEAANLVRAGDCVFVDGGTTLSYMSEFLCQKDIKIVTHSNLFIQNIQGSKAEVIVVGGRYIPKYDMNVGPMTIGMLEKFNFDYAFIGCAGIDISERVATTADLETAKIKQLAIKSSICKYLIISADKINVRGFYRFEKLSEFDAVYIDACPEGVEQLDNIIICDGCNNAAV